MFNLLQQKYQYISNLKGNDLMRFIGIVFLVFVIMGGIIGYVSSSRLTKPEVPVLPQVENSQGAYKTMQGIVTFIGESSYPDEKIEYMLTDAEGKDIILLRASDAKLSIAEGLNVTVTGKLGKTRDGKEDVLQVTEVTLKNGTN